MSQDSFDSYWWRIPLNHYAWQQKEFNLCLDRCGGGEVGGPGGGVRMTLYTQLRACRGRHGKYWLFPRTPPDRESRVHWDLKPWSPRLPSTTHQSTGGVFWFLVPALLDPPPLLAAAGRTRVGRRAEGTNGSATGGGGVKRIRRRLGGGVSIYEFFFFLQFITSVRGGKKQKKGTKKRK